MKERPILFSGEMVRAILDGRKTQTRRVVTPQPSFHKSAAPGIEDCEYFNWKHLHGDSDDLEKLCPYGAPGDKLYVRETHAIVPSTAYRQSIGVEQNINPSDKWEAAVYREGWDRSPPSRWRPSIHMPRWASRITLEIVSVRVERVQDIRWDDVLAEGFPENYNEYNRGAWFKEVWDSINAKRGYGWGATPWVWVIEFKRIKL